MSLQRLWALITDSTSCVSETYETIPAEVAMRKPTELVSLCAEGVAEISSGLMLTLADGVITLTVFGLDRWYSDIAGPNSPSPSITLLLPASTPCLRVPPSVIASTSISASR